MNGLEPASSTIGKRRGEPILAAHAAARLQATLTTLVHPISD
jgi:hypothetical protein